jgi:hypothetical protein
MDEAQPPSFTLLPQLSGLVKPFIDKNSTVHNFICVLFAVPGAALTAQVELFQFCAKNATVTAHWCDPSEVEGNADRYRIGRVATCIVFHNGAEARRFTGPELDELIPFLEAKKPKPAFAGTGRRLDGPAGPPAQFPPLVKSPPPARPSKPPPVDVPPAKPPPADRPPEKRSPVDVPPAKPPPVLTRPDPPWAFFPLKLRPDFKPTPEQEALKEELMSIDFSERDVDFALQETNATDLATLCDWIETYQDTGELWAEVDWILAGRPAPRRRRGRLQRQRRQR